MVRKVLVFLFFVFCQAIFAQKDSLVTKKVSFQFNKVDLPTAFSIIENNTDFIFYYDANWFDEYDKFISKQYKNESLTHILKDILEGTGLNFILYGHKIILTNNNYIYSELPSGFFGSDTLKSQKSINKSPIFYQEYQVNESLYVQKKQEEKSLLFIGKETKKRQNNTFELTGYVRDQKTGQPVSMILIRTKNGKITDITNKNGLYTLHLPYGANTVQAESVGYLTENRKIMMFSDGTLNFELVENINELDQIVIYGNRGENIRTAVTGVTSIEIEKVKKIPMVFGVPDVLKVALLMPGIKSAGEGSAGFNVRGGKTDQNLILLDDAPIYNAFHFFGFFSAVNPYIVGDLDIYKGNIPAEFGGRLSSVFDIQTETPNMKKISGEAGLGPVNGNIMVNVPIIENKASISIGGRYAYADWILRSIDNSSLKSSKASFYDLNIKYEHILNNKNKIELMGYYSKDQFSITPDSLNKYHNRLISFHWEHDFNPRHSGNLYFTNSEYKFNLEYEPGTTQAFDFGYKINETKAKLKFDYALNNKHTFTYGLSGKLYKIGPGTLDPTDPASLLTPIDIADEKGLESAVYLSDAFKVSEKLLLHVGLRYSYFMALGKDIQRVYDPNLPKNDASVIDFIAYDNNETIKTYGGLEVRLGARYLFTDDFSIKGSYTTNNQYTHLLSTNTTQSPMDTWTLSNLNVKPQSSKQYTLGLFKNFNNAMYEISMEGYYKDLHNLLDYKTDAELFLNDNFETAILQGEGKTYGIEFLVKKNFGKFNGWLGYTYSRSLIKLDGDFDKEIVNNGDYFPTNFDKPHDFNLVLNYKFTERYSISANFIYQTGRPVTYPVGTYDYGNAQYTLYSDRNKYRIPDYYRLDIGVNIFGNHDNTNLGRSFWNISVYNLLGRNNPYSVYFVTEDGEIKGYQTSIFSVPIPTITYNFTF